MQGLKRGTVLLCEHSAEWATEAKNIISKVKEIFGDYAIDIQHIGSTAIMNIKAKPIIDIVIGVNNFENLNNYIEPLLNIGIYKSIGQPFQDIILFSQDNENGNRIFNIQVVIYDSESWNKHILFRNYMNKYPNKAKLYEQIKIKAAKLFPNNISEYSNYKNEFISECIQAAQNNIYSF